MEEAFTSDRAVRGSPKPTRRRARRFGVGSYDAGLMTILPVVVAIVVLLLLPGVYTLILSVYDGEVTTRGFVSLSDDELFYRSLYLGFVYAAVTVSIQVGLGMCAAAIIHRLHVSAKILRLVTVLVFLPYAVPSVVAVVIWKFLLLDRGLLAEALSSTLGVDSNIWMGDWIFATLVIVSVWQFYPFVFVTLLARMRRIPPALYRSAQIDGATQWQQFRFVTFPAIKSTLIVVIILRVAFMFTKFDTPFLVGGATANEGVRTLPIYIYEHIGLGLAAKSGVAAAVIMASILFIFIAVVTAIQIRVSRRNAGGGDDCT